MDLSKLSDKDLAALEKGDWKSISNEGLDIIDPPRPIPSGIGDILKIAGQTALNASPNLSAGAMGSNVAQSVAQNPGHPFSAMNQTVNADESSIGAALRGTAAVGQFANQGNQQLAQALGTMGTPGKVAGGALGFASNTLMPQTPIGALATPLLAGAIGEAAPAAGGMIKAGVKKTAAQSLRAGPGIAEAYGRSLIENPAKVLLASSVEQAGLNIAETAQARNLKAGIEGFKEVFGSGAPPGPAQVVKLADESLVGGDFTAALTPQEALSHVQAVNHVELMPKYKNPLNATEMKYISDYKDKLVQLLNDWGHGEVTEALENYHYSMAKKQLMSVLPQNLNNTASQLGFMRMLGLAGASEAQSRYAGKGSNPLRSAAAAATQSPIIAGPLMGAASGALGAVTPALSLPAQLLMMRAAQGATGVNQ